MDGSGPRPPSNTTILRVLLIDDDQEDQILTRDLLSESMGDRVHLDWVSTYEAALTAVRECQHDAYLLDYRLGARTGLQLLQEPELKSCNAPIIFLTGQGEREVDLEAMRLGAADFLTKDGLTAATLERTLRHSLERHRDRAELKRLNEVLETRVAERTRDLERANAALRLADQRKDEFLAILAHELRNPLAPIANVVGLIPYATDDAGIRAEIHDTMRRQVGILTRLVDDLLEVSRISQGKIELRLGTCDARAITRDAIESARPQIERKGQRLEMELADEPIPLVADATRMTQVICNLLNNASKFTDEGGTVTVSLLADPDMVIVRVADNGIGMSADALSRIFELFAQVESTLERSQGGLGIGLTLARTLVEMHGGTLTAASEGPGRGSQFTILLPRTPAAARETRAAAVPSAAEAAEVVSVPTARRRVLIVDDNVDSAATLSRLLALKEQEVRTAHDGVAAIEAAQEFRPDLIFMDIGLPGWNGYDVVRRIRAEPWGKTMQIVALTGWGQAEDRRRSREAGFDDHFVKPVPSAVLDQLLLGSGESP